MDNNEILFWIIFKNIYIKQIIFIQLRLLNNKVVCFNDLDKLINYEQHEYIEELEFNPRYNQDKNLKKGDIKNQNGILKKIYFTNCNNLDNGEIVPIGVKEIQFPYYSECNNNSHLKLLLNLPISVTCIKNLFISNSSNLKLTKDMIPSNIKTLTLCNNKFDKYNQKLDNNTLPPSLTHLNMGYYWKNGCTHLKKGDLPNGLIHLEICDYSQKLNPNVLPQSLKKLSISFPDNYTILHRSIPNSLEELIISNGPNGNLYIVKGSFDKKNSLLSEFWSSVIGLKIDPFSLPYNHLTKIELRNTRIYKNVLPSSLKTLIINDGCLIENGSLNQGLTSFTYDQAIKPITTTSLYHKLIYDEIKFEIGFFPSSLTFLSLSISDNTNFNIENLFPNSLTKLSISFGIKEFKLVSNLLPSSITDLTLINKLDNNIEISNMNSLPCSLINLEISHFTIPILFENIFPITLKQLKIPNLINSDNISNWINRKCLSNSTSIIFI